MAQAGRSNILSIYHFRPSARATSGRTRSRPLVVVRVYIAGATYGDAGVSLFVAAVMLGNLAASLFVAIFGET